MRKPLIITAIMLAVATTALGASGTTVTMDLSDKAKTGLTLYGDDTTASSSTPLIGKTSTGVGLSMATDSAGYALATQHMNGSKAFASSYDSTSIYSEDATKGTVKINVTSSDTSQFSTWDAL